MGKCVRKLYSSCKSVSAKAWYNLKTEYTRMSVCSRVYESERKEKKEKQLKKLLFALLLAATHIKTTNTGEQKKLFKYNK